MNSKAIKKMIKSPEYVTMTTLQVAEMTGKEHRNVLRDVRVVIRSLDAKPALRSERWHETDNAFIETTYKGKNRKQLPMIVLGEDLVTTLLSGYSVGLRNKLVLQLKHLKREMEAYLGQKETRRRLAAGYAPLTDALQARRIEEGKKEKAYIYSNEANMINRMVLGGLSAKQFREKHNVENVRDHLTQEQKDMMTKLQKMRASLVELGHEYKERKEILKNYKKKLDLRAEARKVKALEQSQTTL